MAEKVEFFVYPQSEALSTFLPILKPHLPLSNALFGRLRAPHNHPSRACLFSASFPPPTPGSTANPPGAYTIFFADRSRHAESQIWIFNNLIVEPAPLSATQKSVLTDHLTAMIIFLKDIQIPQAPGWPFSPILRFACVHEYCSEVLHELANSKNALRHLTTWNLWHISTANIASKQRSVPPGFTFGRVPEEQMDIVLSTSTIARQPSTMQLLPNLAALDEDGRLVAWSYVGIDGSLITLYVLEQYRGRGLASFVAVELLARYARGDFRDLGFDGTSGWLHSDVKKGNKESEGVMKSLGGKSYYQSSYIWIDSEKF